MAADGQGSIGASVASAGSYLGGWLGALASTATGSSAARSSLPKFTPAPQPSGASHSLQNAESSNITFESQVKDCQIELSEYLTAECSPDPKESDQ
jgi:hypothetical protein